VCKPKIFSFPKTDVDKENWKKACPNIFQSNETNLYACEWHWPENYKSVSPVKASHLCSRRPKDPPSVFSVPGSFSRSSFLQPRNSLSSSGQRGVLPDELDAFNEADVFKSFEDLKEFCCMEFSDINVISNEKMYVIYDGNVEKMKFCIKIFSDLSFAIFLRGVKVESNLRVTIVRRRSQLIELVREIKQKHADLLFESGQLISFNDRQNELIVKKKFGRRYTASDFSFALRIVSISRSTYLQLRSFIALPSIRLLQNTFKSASSITFESILAELTPMQRHIQLMIDEVYVKKSLRFSGGKIFGYAVDAPNELAKTILVVYAKCDYGGPSFVAAMKPVHRLTSSFQQQVVLNVIERIEQCGSTVTNCTFDGNAINTRMVSTLPNLLKPHVSSYNNHPIFWLYDPVHLFKCIRNNFLTAGELEYSWPNEAKKVAKWDDLVQLQKRDSEMSKSLRTSRLNEVSVKPPLIARQRVDLALRVFCPETAAALNMIGKNETASFVKIISNYFVIMNTRNKDAGKHLRDPLRMPIQSLSCESIDFLKLFSNMVTEMKPPSSRRVPSDKTLTMNTARALVSSIDGYIELSQFLISRGFQYVLFGRYSSDPIERLFGKWRQSSGGNYLISVTEVFEAQRINWANLVNKFMGRDYVTDTSAHLCSLCTSDPDTILDIQSATPASDELLATCAYIAGYLCKKFSFLPTSSTTDSQTSMQLINILDRGGLKYPSETVIDFVLNCHQVFEALEGFQKSCRNFLIQCFELLDDLYDSDIGSEKVYRTMANILQINFSVISTSEHVDKRKIAKLSSS